MEENLMHDPDERGKSTANNSDWKDWIKPGSGLFITLIILAINVILFALQVIYTGSDALFEPTNEGLIQWQANYTPLTLNGEWWRLLTSVFTHIGVLHLAMNMYALFYVGPLLEPLLGERLYTVAYLATGIISSAVSLWWHDITISAGASGAIFGLYGVFAALLVTNLIEKETRKQLLSSIMIFIVYNLVNGLRGGVDNAAHIGGLISGVVIGFIIYFFKRKQQTAKSGLASIASVLAVCILSCLFFIKIIKNDAATYQVLAQDFYKEEAKAVAVYQNSSGNSEEQLMGSIKTVTLPSWRNCRAIYHRMQALNLNAAYTAERAKLVKYTDLRIERDSLVLITNPQNSNTINERINAIDEALSKLLK